MDVLPAYLNYLLEKMPMHNIHIGIGNEVAILDTSASYKQALFSMKAGQLAEPDSHIIRYADLGLFRLIGPSIEGSSLPQLCNEVLMPILESPSGKKLDLIHTLTTYFRSNCNLNQTGRELFIHPSTVQYRLKVVEELCHISLDNYDEALTLQVALKLLPLLFPETS